MAAAMVVVGGGELPCLSFSSITVVAKEIRTSLCLNSPRTGNKRKGFCHQASEGCNVTSKHTELNRAGRVCFSRACSVSTALLSHSRTVCRDVKMGGSDNLGMMSGAREKSAQFGSSHLPSGELKSVSPDVPGPRNARFSAPMGEGDSA